MDDHQCDPSLQGDWVKKFVGEDIMTPPKNPILKDVDPHADDLSDEIKQAIVEECRVNPAYFIEYVLQTTPDDRLSGWRINLLQLLIQSETIFPVSSGIPSEDASGNVLMDLEIQFHNCANLPARELKFEYTEAVKGDDPLAKWFTDWAALSLKNK